MDVLANDRNVQTQHAIARRPSLKDQTRCPQVSRDDWPERTYLGMR